MKKLGRYRLTELLGQGGMGDVYAAVSEGLGGFEKKVCIKVMNKALAGNERAVELFLREARLAARLTHPNIVQIFELGREQGTYFIAMEMLEGMPWHDIAQRAWRHGKVLPLEVIVTAAAQAADALQYAHTLKDKDGNPAGMVHRDVSPDNLFLTTEGITKVLDFGIAKATDQDATRLTEKGELRGKLPYMPPEQVKTEDVDGAADVWALGITLFYLSTAQRPFDRDTPLHIMNAILKEPAISASSMNPVLPKAFSDVIARCLQKPPRDRWPSGAALKDALLNLLPVPIEAQKARDLLALAQSLEKGDRRPLSAQPSAPTMSWEKPKPPAPASSSSSGSSPRPEDRLPTRQVAKQPSKKQPAPQPPTKQAPTKPAKQTAPEKTTVSAPLLTADESADGSVVAVGDDDSSEEDDSLAEGFAEDAATLAEMPSLELPRPNLTDGIESNSSSSEPSDPSNDDANDGGDFTRDMRGQLRSEPTVAVAMAFSSEHPIRGPEQPDFHAQPTAPQKDKANETTASATSFADPDARSVISATPADPALDVRPPELPTNTYPKPPSKEPAPSTSTAFSSFLTNLRRDSGSLPVWVFGVAAFGITVVLALLIVFVVHLIRS